MAASVCIFTRSVPRHSGRALDDMLRLFPILAIMFGLTACRTPAHVTDLREGSAECELHHKIMRSAQVPAGVGCVLPRVGYLEARDRMFPHSFPRWLESRRDFCIVYVCDDCILAETEWSKTH